MTPITVCLDVLALRQIVRGTRLLQMPLPWSRRLFRLHQTTSLATLLLASNYESLLQPRVFTE